MKYSILAAAVVAVMMSGCGKADRIIAHYTGYSKICIDGVSYLQFTSGATVQRDRNGQVVRCE